MKLNKCFRMCLKLATLFLACKASANEVGPMEIGCHIRANGISLSCQVLAKDRRVMNPEDVTNFIDAAEVAGHLTLKSRKGYERTFLIDNKSPQFKRLHETKRSAPISEIAKAKTDLFSDIERRVIKLSDELDAQRASSDLVLADPHIAFDKFQRERRVLTTELEGYRSNREKICTNTPAFETMSRANARLQSTLSNIVLAFQTPNSCMANFKIFKDNDGTVDLRQLDTAPDFFKNHCRQ